MESNDGSSVKAACVQFAHELMGGTGFLAVSAWLAMRTDNCFEGTGPNDTIEEEAAYQVWVRVDDDLGSLTADEAHDAIRGYVELAKSYGVQRWPEEALTNYFADQCGAGEVEEEDDYNDEREAIIDRARHHALPIWDKALAEYEEHHAKLRRRRGLLHICFSGRTH